MPERIQRKRTKGWKSPENTVYVGRPTMWGNPFIVRGDMIYYDAWHRRKILNRWVLFNDNAGYKVEDVVKLFRDLMMDLNSHKVEAPIYERFRLMRDRIKDLQGKNLSCWCKKDECCHADVLLEIANL